MKRQWKMILCLLMALTVLSACSGQNPQGDSGPVIYAQATQYLGPVTETAAPAPTADNAAPNADTGGMDNSIFSANPYDVAPDDGGDLSEAAVNEEGYVDTGLGDAGGDGLVAMLPEGTVYPYAGSTPIPIDPVDMPSPTPRPELTFTYATFTAGSLGLSFEAPSGWMADDSQTDVFTVTEPENEMHDGQQCVITISAVPVNNNYSERELKSEVTQRLKDLGSVNFVVWSPSLTATRYLMGSKGVYANYTGTLANGIELAGRILYVCLDNKLYGIEMVFPRSYRDDYLNVFSQIRQTIARQ